MKKGAFIAFDTFNSRGCAAMLYDGLLVDLLMDSLMDMGASEVVPEAIYFATAGRDLPRQKAMMVDLGAGATGFLKYKTPPTERAFLVQVKTHVGEGKAAPVRESPLLKGRYVILVLGESGAVNVSKAIDPDRRDVLKTAVADAAGDASVILRTACQDGLLADIIAEVRDMVILAADIRTRCADGGVGLVHAAPSARELALRDWGDVPIIDEAGCFERLGVADQIESLDSPIAGLPNGARMVIESTSALVAVDVDTGGDFGGDAGARANFACAGDLPRQLRLRGLGGQIVIDPAPMPKRDRTRFEMILRKALTGDDVPTEMVGWTKLGHYELQRKRSR